MSEKRFILRAKKKKVRNWGAVAAHFKGSAGPMGEKKATLKRSKNPKKNIIEETDE